MTRSKSTKSPPPQFYTGSSSHPVTGKRDFAQQLDMQHSASYTYGATSWPSTGAEPAQHHSDIRVYEPGAYVSKLATSSDPSANAAKRQKTEGYDARQLSFPPSLAYSTFLPTALTVSPSTSMSSQPSQKSLASSEAMSRTSSVTTSLTDAVDMMRVESSFSNCSDLPFPFEQQELDASFASGTTAKPTGRLQAADGFEDGSDHAQLLSNLSHGFVGQDLPFVESSSFAVGCGEGHAQAPGFSYDYAQNMQRTDSEQSTSSISSTSSTEPKTSESRRKHIENARQSIAPKHLPKKPTSTPAGDANLLKPEDAIRRKEAISRTPYVRPQHPKLYCTLCEEYPAGFRGEHELRRHYDRAHAETRRVWICVEPMTTSKEGWWPQKPLGICKQCKQQKHYNVYYNAAAHLRRAHFCPRKRGRKARGEERESRAGKAGGDWPPIEWLKANGWLKEIEISSAQYFASDKSGPSHLRTDGTEDGLCEDEMDSTPDSAISMQQATLAADTLGLQPFPLQSLTDFTYDYPTPSLDPTTCFTKTPFAPTPADPSLQAPPMAHTLSAPPALPSHSAFETGMMYDPNAFVVYPIDTQQFPQ